MQRDKQPFLLSITMFRSIIKVILAIDKSFKKLLVYKLGIRQRIRYVHLPRLLLFLLSL